MDTQYEIQVYITPENKCPVLEWLFDLHDKEIVGRIWARFYFLEIGHFGDSKPVGDGVHEARYYFGQQKDIETAKAYKKDYYRRVKQ